MASLNCSAESFSPEISFSVESTFYQIGEKVQLQPYNDVNWHTVEILDEDADEQEVLCHFEDLTQPDIWISVSRIRPMERSTGVVLPDTPESLTNYSSTKMEMAQLISKPDIPTQIRAAKSIAESAIAEQSEMKVDGARRPRKCKFQSTGSRGEALSAPPSKKLAFKKSPSKKSSYKASPSKKSPSKKRGRQKKKSPLKTLKKFNPTKPWVSSSSSENEDEDEENHYEFEEEEDYTIFNKWDHEFSAESEAEDGGLQPVNSCLSGGKGGVIEGPKKIADFPCKKCGGTDDSGTLLMCGKCNDVWHTSCLRPVLHIIPEGDWFCPNCNHVGLINRVKEVIMVYDVLQEEVKNNELKKKLADAETALLSANEITAAEEEPLKAEERRSENQSVDSSQMDSNHLYNNYDEVIESVVKTHCDNTELEKKQFVPVESPVDDVLSLNSRTIAPQLSQKGNVISGNKLKARRQRNQSDRYSSYNEAIKSVLKAGEITVHSAKVENAQQSQEGRGEERQGSRNLDKDETRTLIVGKTQITKIGQKPKQIVNKLDMKVEAHGGSMNKDFKCASSLVITNGVANATSPFALALKAQSVRKEAANNPQPPSSCVSATIRKPDGVDLHYWATLSDDDKMYTSQNIEYLLRLENNKSHDFRKKQNGESDPVSLTAKPCDEKLIDLANDIVPPSKSLRSIGTPTKAIPNAQTSKDMIDKTKSVDVSVKEVYRQDKDIQEIGRGNKRGREDEPTNLSKLSTPNKGHNQKKLKASHDRGSPPQLLLRRCDSPMSSKLGSNKPQTINEKTNLDAPSIKPRDGNLIKLSTDITPASQNLKSKSLPKSVTNIQVPRGNTANDRFTAQKDSRAVIIEKRPTELSTESGQKRSQSHGLNINQSSNKTVPKEDLLSQRMLSHETDIDSSLKSPQIKSSVEGSPQPPTVNLTHRDSTHELEQSSVICHTCGLILQNSDLLIQHMVTHKTLTEFGLQSPIKEMRSEKSLKPSGVDLTNKNSLPSLDDSRSHTCQVCDKKFRTANDLNRHVFSHKTVQETLSENSPQPPTVDLTYGDIPVGSGTGSLNTCQVCDKVFRNPASLHLHMLTHKSQTKSPQEKPVNIVRSNMPTKSNQSKRLGGKVYTCPECGKLFASPLVFNQHLSWHRRETNSSQTSEDDDCSVTGIRMRKAKNELVIKSFEGKSNLAALSEAITSSVRNQTFKKNDTKLITNVLAARGVSVKTSWVDETRADSPCHSSSKGNYSNRQASNTGFAAPSGAVRRNTKMRPRPPTEVDLTDDESPQMYNSPRTSFLYSCTPCGTQFVDHESFMQHQRSQHREALPTKTALLVVDFKRPDYLAQLQQLGVLKFYMPLPQSEQ